MGRPAGKWPTCALENLEDSLYRLKQMERTASAVQDAIIAGDDAVALKGLSDVRVMALECVDALVRSRIGKYQQQERTPRWQQPTDQETQVVAQVAAMRRP